MKRTLLVLLILVALFTALPASADPYVCGHLTVTVLGTPYPVTFVNYCNEPCPGGIGQGPNKAWVGPVVIDNFQCASGI